MGRALYRGGSGSLKTALELSELLPVPIYRILTGSAKSVFSSSNPASPSPIVMVVSVRSPSSLSLSDISSSGLPLSLNNIQWEQVAVPVLEDDRVSSWRGALKSGGSPVTLPVSVVAPDGSIARTSNGTELVAGLDVGVQSPTREQVGNLFDNGIGEFIRLIGSLVFQKATERGY